MPAGMHIHLVGIGGAGLSAIARVLLARGFVVSGSDMQAGSLTDDLGSAGATIYIGHAAAQIAGAALVVISSAIPATNPELIAAREQGIPVVKRDVLLGALMAGTTGIAVAGTHGKTTTTGMISQILIDAAHDPTVIVGGVLPGIGSNGRAGQGRFFVVEADEYDHMFLGLRPTIAILNNVEHDHPDIFADARSYHEAFVAFAHLLPESGWLVAGVDDPGVQQVIAGLKTACGVVTFGLGPHAMIRAEELRPNPLGGTDFLLTIGIETVGLVRLRVPGEHNVRNALAALAVGQTLDVPFEQMVRTLAAFGGVERRFQELGSVGDVVVIDDYAHHPTEIRVTLAAARQRYPGRRLWAVWQPHTYSRTRLMLDAFVKSLESADQVVVLDIYRSREQDNLGLDAAQIMAQMAHHPAAIHAADFETAATHILDRVLPGDVVLTLGAGDGNRAGELVLAGLRRRFGS
jgi:UDP-N-acetylmuramate--alanine ligase